MTATLQSRGPCERRRRVLPVLVMGIGAIVAGTVAATIRVAEDSLSPLEEHLVGRWFTSHGNVETTLELRRDHTVTIAQTIRVRLAPGDVRQFGPTITAGRWRMDKDHLCLETTSPQLGTAPWNKVGVLVRSHRWPARGELHRDWRLDSFAPDRFRFTDLANGQRGRAVKAAPVVALAR